MIAIAIVLAHRRLLKMDGERTPTVVAYGLAVQLLQVASMATLFAYLNVPLHQQPAYLAVFLLSSIAAVLPLSVGGLGAREITFLYGLQFLKLDPAPGSGGKWIVPDHGRILAGWRAVLG
jgi:hypothetical protein